MDRNLKNSKKLKQYETNSILQAIKINKLE